MGRAFAETTRDHECCSMRAFECETRDEDENRSKPPSGGIQWTDSNNAKRAHIPVPPSPCVSLPPLSRGHNVPPRGRGRRSRDCTHCTYYAPAKLVAAYPVGHLLRRRRRRRHLPRPTAYARRRFVLTKFLPTLLDFCCFLHRGEHVHSEVLVVVACGFHAQ